MDRSHKLHIIAYTSVYELLTITFPAAVAVLGENIWEEGAPHHLGGNSRLSEITIEPIKNLGAGQDSGGLCPWPQHRTATDSQSMFYAMGGAAAWAGWAVAQAHPKFWLGGPQCIWPHQ